MTRIAGRILPTAVSSLEVEQRRMMRPRETLNRESLWGILRPGLGFPDLGFFLQPKYEGESLSVAFLKDLLDRGV